MSKSKTNKKVAIIGTNGLPGRYGGWDQLMNHLIELEDYSFTVYTSSYDAQASLKEYKGAKLEIVKLKANGIQSIPYDIYSMLHAVFTKQDILLVLGTSGCISLPFIKLFRKKIILNSDGAEWKRGKWNGFAKWFLRISEKIGVKYADAVICDNKIIQSDILTDYGINSSLIEYGGDNAKFVVMSEDTMSKYNITPNNYAFKVCRIEPENNIDLILEAFSKCELMLIIIGNWNFSQYGKNLRNKYKYFSNLLLLDPIYEQTQLDELRGNCGIYVHGHSVGGTNPSLVEAMNLGLCCVVYKVNYNIETTENAAIYFSNKEELLETLIKYDNKEIDLSLYRDKMTEIAKRRYQWSIITAKYSELFQ